MGTEGISEGEAFELKPEGRVEAPERRQWRRKSIADRGKQIQEPGVKEKRGSSTDPRAG